MCSYLSTYRLTRRPKSANLELRCLSICLSPTTAILCSRLFEEPFSINVMLWLQTCIAFAWNLQSGCRWRIAWTRRTWPRFGVRSQRFKNSPKRWWHVMAIGRSVSSKLPLRGGWYDSYSPRCHWREGLTDMTCDTWVTCDLISTEADDLQPKLRGCTALQIVSKFVA